MDKTGLVSRHSLRSRHATCFEKESGNRLFASIWDFLRTHSCCVRSDAFRKKDEQFEKIDIDVDLIILCTGYGLDFDWIGVEGEEHSIEPNPRKWFKHCFPPGLGHKVAFLGYARPNQGKIF